jgi:hypothetical protein
VEQLSELEKELMAGFVNKPYRPNELLVAVEDTLDRRHSESHDRDANCTTSPSIPNRITVADPIRSQLANEGKAIPGSRLVAFE